MIKGRTTWVDADRHDKTVFDTSERAVRNRGGSVDVERVSRTWHNERLDGIDE